MREKNVQNMCVKKVSTNVCVKNVNVYQQMCEKVSTNVCVKNVNKCVREKCVEKMSRNCFQKPQ